MNSLKVLIYEDQCDSAVMWAKYIQEAYGELDVKTVINEEDFVHLLQLIHQRRKDWREGSNECPQDTVDTTDIIIADYDLLRYSDTADTTGSRLAYLLRCFTQCGFIIVLNEYGTNVFDLSLGSPTKDFTDLHIGARQLGNRGLWQASFEGYRPWHWPVVPHARKNFEKCVEDIQKHPDAPILEFLGLSDVIDWLPSRARHFLSGKAKIEEITLENFLDVAHGGIAAKDKLIPHQRARVTAARLGVLLNSIILPEQSILVDAPHLASRFPSVIRQNRDSIDMWNKLCNPVANDIDDAMVEELKRHRYPKPHWLWRPAWYWSKVNQDENIKEVKDPWTYQEVDWVFCENISRFVPTQFARGFRALVSPPFIKRFIFQSDAQGAEQYVKQIRNGGPQDLCSVDYVPQAALSS